MQVLVLRTIFSERKTSALAKNSYELCNRTYGTGFKIHALNPGYCDVHVWPGKEFSRIHQPSMSPIRRARHGRTTQRTSFNLVGRLIE